MKKIKIGLNDAGSDFSLPLDAQTITSAVLGIRGSGKTNTAAVVAEGLIRADRQCIVIAVQLSEWIA